MREDKINGRKKEYIIFREREREAGRERRMGGEREGSSPKPNTPTLLCTIMVNFL